MDRSLAFAALTPKPFWRWFEQVSAIPRPSGREERVRDWLVSVARERGLVHRTDAIGNVVLVVPATEGDERAPTVVLQAHMDMVCEKNKEREFDFLAEPIPVRRDGNWLCADGTTLGGDNGVGIAAALSLIDDGPARHGPLELLFTVDEERGLTGARQVDPALCSGRLMLNLDSEEEGFVTIGCAGGGDTIVSLHVSREELPAGSTIVQVEVKGLVGGHSGIDIDKHRANALRCMGRLLDRGAAGGGLRLASLVGGNARNAIPREATAILAVSSDARERLSAAAAALQAELRNEYGAIEPDLTLSVGPAPAGAARPLSAVDSQRALALLLATPTGVTEMNRDIALGPETSTNFGVAATEGDTIRFTSMTRSSIASAIEGVRAQLRATGEALGAEVELDSAYPGWKPDPQSALLARFQDIHDRVTGHSAKVLVIHAGLECGMLGERFPGSQMISFGPDLHDVHTPRERLSIPSTGRFLQLLSALVESLATRPIG
jgi:dipeptidase D